MLFSNSPKRRIDKLTNAYLAIESETAHKADKLGFMARSMVLATLPHSKPNNFHYQRRNGDYSLTIVGNPQFGLPYGSLPRLLLVWISREVILTKSNVLHLGKTFSEFLRVLNLSSSGGCRGDASRLREQMLKLFTSHISCTYQNKKKGIFKIDQYLLARSFKLWWTPFTNDKHLFSDSSTVVLAKDFYEELIDRPVPLDLRVLHALRRSPLQIDIYMWLTHRFSYLKTNSVVPWDLLRCQFGSNYAANAQGSRDFRRQFLKALHVVTSFYTEAQIEIQQKGLLLKPSLTHIKSRRNGAGT